MPTDATSGSAVQAGAGDGQPITNPVEVLLTRRKVLEAATALAFSQLDATKLGTAVSELARNVLEHGGGGRADWAEVREGGRVGLKVTFTDQGAGIGDLDSALSDGFTTAGGMGLGLPGARRLVDDLGIESVPGAGTRVEILKWK